MIINSIKFRLSGQDVEHIWRFSSPQGSGRHLAIVAGSDEAVLSTMTSAFCSFLNGEIPPQATITIVASDDDGESWQMESSPAGLMVRKNGTLQKLGTGTTPVSLFLSPYEIRHQTRAAIRQILRKGDLITSRPFGITKTSDQFLTTVDEKIDQLCGQIAQLMDDEAFADSARVLGLADRIGLLWAQDREVRELSSRMQTDADLDPSAIKNLADELVLLERIVETARPLSQPNASGRILREQLAAFEKNLSDTLSRYGLTEDHIPRLTELPWQDLIAAATAVDAKKTMAQEADRAAKVASSELRPLVERHLSSLEAQLGESGGLAHEISHYLVQANEEDSKRRDFVWARLQSRLKLLSQIWQKPKAENTSSFLPAPIVALSRAQAAANEALACLTDTSQQVEKIRTQLDQSVGRALSSHEALAKDVTAARQRWKHLAESHGLPSSLSLTHLIQLAETQFLLREWISRRDQILAALHDRRQKLIDLQKLISRWRQLAGSHLQGDLTNSTILLTEARHLADVKEEKSKTFQKLMDRRESELGNIVGRRHLGNRLTEIATQWTQAFDEVGVPRREMGDGRWKEFFRAVQEIKALSALRGCGQETDFAQWMNGLQQDSTQVNILWCARPHLPLAQAAAFAEIIADRGRDRGIFFVVTTDQGIFDLVAQKHGALARHSVSKVATTGTTSVIPPRISTSPISQREKNAPANPSPSVTEKAGAVSAGAPIPASTKAPNADQSTILSPRVKAVLDILNHGKR